MVYQLNMAILAGGEIQMLPELLILSVSAIIAVLVLRRARLPVIAGMLAAGALVGPEGFHLVSSSAHLDAFAETGVALLLFTIGLEFNRSRLAATGLRAVLAGCLQVGLTMLVAALVARFLGLGFTQSLFAGMAVSLSSTAIVLRALTDRSELSAPHGRLILGTLIIQDLAIVPMLIAVPMLAGSGGSPVAGLGLLVLKAAALLGLAFLGSRFLLPWLMREISAVGSRDVFLLTALSLALGLAWLTYAAGLSPALGAFIAGIMLANSEYAHHALSEVLPVRELFFSFFFITMGMLFNWRLLIEHPVAVLGILALLLVAKGIIAALSVLLLRFPARIAVLFGLGLAQFGEFGYLLLKAGGAPPLETAILQPGQAQILLCAGLLSMFLTPLILAAAPHFTAGERMLRPLERLLRVRGIDEPHKRHECASGHVIVAGLGPAGIRLIDALRDSQRNYVVLEMNSDTVRRLQQAGEPVYYGDVTSPEALEHACLNSAAAVVITFHDRQAIRRALAVIRRASPSVPVIVRAAYETQVPGLEKLGASVVIVDELATGGILVEKTLRCLG